MTERRTKNKIGTANIVAYGRPESYRFSNFTDTKGFTTIAEAAQSEDIKKVTVPRVSFFNARTALTNDFPITYKFQGVEIRTGIDADAVILRPGENALIVTGDCPTLVISNEKTGEVAAAHAGRDSLIDRVHIDTGIPSRKTDTVVESILLATGWEPRDLSAFICAGIGPEYFTHPWEDPVHGERNRKMIQWIIERYGKENIVGKKEEGRIDMPTLIRSQCILLGVNPSQTYHDGIDTYTDERFWSHRNREKNEGRNAALVTNERK